MVSKGALHGLLLSYIQTCPFFLHWIFIFHSTWRTLRKIPESPVGTWSTLAEQHLSACFSDSFPIQVFPLHSFSKNASLFICRPPMYCKIKKKKSSCFSTLGIPLVLETRHRCGAEIPSRRTCQEWCHTGHGPFNLCILGEEEQVLINYIPFLLLLLKEYVGRDLQGNW